MTPKISTAHNRLAGLLLAISFSLGTASAAIINLDFGLTPYAGGSANGPLASGTVWNNRPIATVTSSLDGVAINNLLDDSGSPTDVDLTFGTGWTGFYNDSGPNNLQRDRAYTDNGGVGNLTISGLTPGGTYDLALAGMPVSGGIFSTDFTLGATTLSASGSSAGSNANGPLSFTAGQTHALFSGVTADGSGELSFTTTQTNPGPGNFGVLSGLQISDSPEPAPTTFFDFSTDPNIAGDWTEYGYFPPESTTVTWDSGDQNLDLSKPIGNNGLGLYPTGALRQPGDPVSLTVSDIFRTGGTWGFLGLMISAVPQPGYVTTTDDSYTLALFAEGGTNMHYEVRRTYQDGTGDFILYQGPSFDFASLGEVDLEILRNGDEYDFLADGILLYTTGTAPGDFYDLVAKDSLSSFQIVLNGDSEITATIDNFGFSSAVAPIPEPGSFVLAGLGLLGVISLGRRRRRAAPIDHEA